MPTARASISSSGSSQSGWATVTPGWPEIIPSGWHSNNLLNLGNPEAPEMADQPRGPHARPAGHRLLSSGLQHAYSLDDWRRNDAPDRQGLTENLYVQGYLAYWDALRRRQPQLRIDSCASGGRRDDLETLRRAVSR